MGDMPRKTERGARRSRKLDKAPVVVDASPPAITAAGVHQRLPRSTAAVDHVEQPAGSTPSRQTGRADERGGASHAAEASAGASPPSQPVPATPIRLRIALHAYGASLEAALDADPVGKRQVVAVQEDGSRVLTADIDDLVLAQCRILSLGPDAEVLEPFQLREACRIAARKVRWTTYADDEVAYAFHEFAGHLRDAVHATRDDKVKRARMMAHELFMLGYEAMRRNDLTALKQALPWCKKRIDEYSGMWWYPVAPADGTDAQFSFLVGVRDAIVREVHEPQGERIVALSRFRRAHEAQVDAESGRCAPEIEQQAPGALRAASRIIRGLRDDSSQAMPPIKLPDDAAWQIAKVVAHHLEAGPAPDVIQLARAVLRTLGVRKAETMFCGRRLKDWAKTLRLQT